MTRQQYVIKYGPISAKACKGTGLFASVMLAQGIIETSRQLKDGSWGPDETNPLFIANNHFGIKDAKNDSWFGAKILIWTREFLGGKYVKMQDNFRKYATVEEGFTDRINFLKQNKRYTTNGVFSATTYRLQAGALQKAGYATDPNYAKTIIGIIEKLDLTIYDKGL